MPLRDYQAAAVDGAMSALVSEPDSRPLLVVPTGAGKTWIAGGLCARILDMDPGARILVCAHVRELVAQNAAALLQVCPGQVGIYSAGLGRRDTTHRVIATSIQSWARIPSMPRIDVMIVDEAHRVPHRGRGQYGDVWRRVQAINPHARLVGMTATPYRMTGGRIDEGDGAPFTGVAYQVQIPPLIEAGYLSSLTSRAGSVTPDLSRVRTARGDYVQSELGDAMLGSVDAALDEATALAAERKAWLVFCAGVDHAHAVCEGLMRREIPAAVLTGETPSDEREAMIGAYKRGALRALVSVNVLTTGFDAPHTDCLILLRPTQSVGLHVQILGRGMRIAEDKTDCLVLDYAGNLERLGPIDAPNEPRGASKTTSKDRDDEDEDEDERGQGDGERGDPLLDITASDAAAMAGQQTPRWLDVDRVRYYPHTKPGKPKSLRVHYLCGPRVVREWVCLEHTGYPRRKAAQWWTRRSSTPPPEDVAFAVRAGYAGALAEPQQILVQREGRFDRIVEYRWPERDRKTGS